MKSRIPVGLVMMLVAMVMSFIPAASVATQPAAALSTCDWAQFVSDVTVPDGTSFAPGASFTKTWRLKNIGTCTWTTSYSLVYSSGDKMGGPTSVNLPNSVPPGQTVDISLNLTAPNNAGHYIGYWKFKNGSGVLFGIGSAANSAWWVEINVTSGGAVNEAYDFVPNYCSATWYSSAGSLPCPGTDGDSRGFVIQVNQPQLENGQTNSGGGLITQPQNVYNGDIHGVFPPFHVQSGDHFKSIVNCAYGATNCYVTFHLDYQIGNGPIYTMWSFREKYEGLYYQADVDLSSLAGQDVKFILTVLATGSASGDRALWVNPYIARAGGTPPVNARWFDFGTSSSPVASGYSRVTESTAYSSGGFGWTDTSTLESRDRSSQSDPLKRDFVMSASAARTFKVDMPNGTYAVTITMGDNDFPHDNMVVKANGNTILADVDTAAGSYSINTFNVTVSNGSLSLEFSDAGGTDSTWVVNGVSINAGSQPPAACDRAQFVADVTVPDGTTYAPGTAFTKTWRIKNIGTCTWSTSYSMVFDSGDKMSGPDSVPMPQTVVPGQTVDVSVSLTAPATGGTYRGYWKFQNANGVRFGIGTGGTQAWWVDIRVTGTPVGRNYDFGTSSSPVASGFNRVTESTAYSSGGFGWTDISTLESRDRSGINDDLRRDFVMSSSAARTFRVDLPNGTYAVNVIQGDHDFAHDNMIVKANGTTMLGDVDTAANTYASNTFNVTVTSGSISLEFSDGGGTDPAWVVNAVTITAGSQPPASCDRVQFIADVTVPDGTVFAPNAGFTKTWRLKNVGTCTWTTSYALVFESGEKMGGPDSVAMPKTVVPGDTVDVSVNLTAPNAVGSYRGYWRFQNANGVRFGLGSDGTKAWWVDIRVSGTPASGYNYDFGTSSSPVAAGFNRVTETTAYSSGGFGWTDTSTLESRDRSTVSDPLRRDFVMSSSASRGFRVDLPSKSYTVTLTMGDNDFAHDNMQVKANGTVMLADVDSAAGSYAVNSFNVNVTTGSLLLEFADLGGSDPTWVVNGVTIAPSSTTSDCDRAQLIADVTVPDGTLFSPGTTFTKTWRLKNIGTCTWTPQYLLVFDSGNQMGGPSSVNLPVTVVPGQTVDLSLQLTAPNAGGSYRGYWKFQNANGVRFGIGSSGTTAWWVDIRVSGPTATPGTPTPGTPTATPQAGTQYDFAANACQGVWFSGAGQLPCPGSDGDQKGFVLKLSNPQLENGTVDPRMGLLTYPQNVYNGYIQGIFPPYRVKAGDRFRSIVNCAYGATSCYVVFRLDYQTGSGPITTFWAFVEKYEGQFYQADLDLSPLVGQDIKFILTVLSTGSPTGDRALWVAPVIYNGQGLPPVPTTAVTATPTVPTATGTPPTPSATATAPTATATSPSPTVTGTPPTVAPTATGTDTTGWNAYQDAKYGFQFKMPPGSTIASQTDTSGRVFLPFTAGTNLVQKYIDVSVVEGAATCKSPNSTSNSTSENVTINGIQFLKETGGEGAAGNVFEWTGYSTTKGTACISINFVLHSTNPDVYPTPPPLFDKNAESAVFPVIMSTYANQ